LAPWLITGWQPGTTQPAVMVAVGAALAAAGCGVLLHSFARFALDGLGTPAPQAPTERLVVGGLYRYVRNPMYLALQAILIGQVLLLDRPVLLLYAAAVAVTTAAFTRWYEEPALRRRYGEQYEQYRRQVPGWLPRRPARPSRRSGPADLSAPPDAAMKLRLPTRHRRPAGPTAYSC
jgi:protein-S-isoprenylcysteine O-methyltransferase Ste14